MEDLLLKVTQLPEDSAIFFLTLFRDANGQSSVPRGIVSSGMGIDEENKDRIFDAFFSTKSRGMGMGLSISRSIIEEHGGRLWAENNPDRGVTFSFTAPIAEQSE